MDTNQQNQQTQAQNQAPGHSGMAMQMQQNANMIQMQGASAQAQRMQMYGQGGHQSFGGMPQMQNQAQQANLAMMQQMAASNQGAIFQQQRVGQPQMPGAPPPPGQANSGSQYRAKQPGQMGQHPAMQGAIGMQGGQQMGRGVQGMIQSIPGFGSMQNMPGGLIEGINNKVPGLFNNPPLPQNSSGAPKKKHDPSTALYIGNLSNTTFDLDLYKFFTSQGYKLKGTRVMFDEQSRSRGFGYLNFHDAQEAQRCLEEMNNSIIGGKAIVLNKQKDRDFDSNANLIVRNLPKSFDQRQMAEMFSKFGKIGSCKLEIYPNGDSRGFGYVQYDNVESAKKAIAELDGNIIDNQKISVLIHSKKENREGLQSERYTNLFLQNLPQDFKQDQLRDLFKNYGEILSVELGSKPGHGYVNFKDHNDAKKALESVNMKLKLGDETILCQPHIYKKESNLQPTGSQNNPIVQNQKELFKSNIFVRFIPNDVTKEELESEFSKAGQICSIKMRGQETTNFMDGSKVSNYQVAYVLYADVKSAQKCIRLFDSQRPFGYNHKALKVDFWQAQEDLKQERDERSQNQIKQLINFIKSQSGKSPYIQGGYQGPMQQNQVTGPQGMMPQQNFGYYGQGQESHDNQKGDQRQNAGKRGTNNQRGNRGGQRGGQRGGHQGQRGGHKSQGQRPQTHQQNSMMPNQQNIQSQHINQQHSPNELRLPTIDPSPLETLKGEDRENFVGNNIYGPIFAAYGQEEAPTITGMILDEGAVDYKELLTNQAYFIAKVQEARAIFKKSQAEQTAQQQQ